jgi:hypothetical protein
LTGDARFEDALAGPVADRPLRLRAESEEDLAVIAALVQDAVTETGEVSWMPRRRRFAILFNRFRWEDAETARAEGRAFERVRAVLAIDGALRVRAQGIGSAAPDTVLAVLSLGFVGDGQGGGTIHVILAGDGAFAVDVECLDVSLTDVTRPYQARAATPPSHPAD